MPHRGFLQDLLHDLLPPNVAAPFVARRYIGGPLDGETELVEPRARTLHPRLCGDPAPETERVQPGAPRWEFADIGTARGTYALQRQPDGGRAFVWVAALHPHHASMGDEGSAGHDVGARQAANGLAGRAGR